MAVEMRVNMKYRDQRDGFDLHIVCFDVCYEEDYHVVTCTVTYPSIEGQEPIKIDYNPTDNSTLSFEVIRARMLEDIDAFVQSPELWIRNYVKQSKDTHRELLEAQLALEQHKKSLADHQKDVTYHEQWVTRWQQKVQELQAGLEHDRSCDE
jgi:hypothetical protein